MPKSLSQKEYILQIPQNNKDKYDLSLLEYKNLRSKIIIICNNHGEFTIGAREFIRGSGCQKCSKKISIMNLTHQKLNKICRKDNFIKKAKEKFNFDYSLVEFKNLRTPVKIICKKHGVFKQKPIVHLNSKIGCPKCFENVLNDFSNKNKLSQKYIINTCSKIHNNKYSYNYLSYINTTSLAIITCPIHGNFKQRITDHLNGHGCSKCTHIISKAETNWLDSLNIKKENRQVSLPGLPKRWKVDGYDPETNTVYEFVGGYWHGDPEIYCSTDKNPTNKKTYKQLYNKTIKREIKIRKAGYNYNFIWERDLI